MRRPNCLLLAVAGAHENRRPALRSAVVYRKPAPREAGAHEFTNANQEFILLVTHPTSRGAAKSDRASAAATPPTAHNPRFPSS